MRTRHISSRGMLDARRGRPATPLGGGAHGVRRYGDPILKLLRFAQQQTPTHLLLKLMAKAKKQQRRSTQLAPLRPDRKRRGAAAQTRTPGRTTAWTACHQSAPASMNWSKRFPTIPSMPGRRIVGLSRRLRSRMMCINRGDSASVTRRGIIGEAVNLMTDQRFTPRVCAEAIRRFAERERTPMQTR